jgi:hypothetical protein
MQTTSQQLANNQQALSHSITEIARLKQQLVAHKGNPHMQKMLRQHIKAHKSLCTSYVSSIIACQQ